jgi:hypothetical protein
MKLHTESRLKLKTAQRGRLLKLAVDRKASRKNREWAKKQLTESDQIADGASSSATIPKRPDGCFAIEKGDPIIALANGASTAFDTSVSKTGHLGPEFGGLGLFTNLPKNINRVQFRRWLASHKRIHTAASFALRDLAGFKLHLGFKAVRAKK